MLYKSTFYLLTFTYSQTDRQTYGQNRDSIHAWHICCHIFSSLICSLVIDDFVLSSLFCIILVLYSFVVFFSSLTDINSALLLLLLLLLLLRDRERQKDKDVHQKGLLLGKNFDGFEDE